MSGRAKDVELIAVSKAFGSTHAVRPLSLHVEAGEFLTLLGPSGCGKTTLLRLIAGLEQVTDGQIRVGGEDVTDQPPNQRDTSIMFQDYALFPHKTLIDNIAYGLKMRRIPKRERHQRAMSWLQTIELSGLGNRFPHQLSGGQRQRVALARSLIVEPGVLLLDEPLGALDANLRRQMQHELKRVHQDVGLTFVYVTHDQEEALTMSDRIAVMRDGRVEQLGTPSQIYDYPETEFVARFIGLCNVIEVRVEACTPAEVTCSAAGLPNLTIENAQARTLTKGDLVCLALRPEAIRVKRGETPPGRNGACLRVEDVTFVGSTLKIKGSLGTGQMLDIDVNRNEPGYPAPERGEDIVAEWTTSAATILRRSPNVEGAPNNA